jgi:hypothetical protein
MGPNVKPRNILCGQPDHCTGRSKSQIYLRSIDIVLRLRSANMLCYKFIYTQSLVMTLTTIVQKVSEGGVMQPNWTFGSYRLDVGEIRETLSLALNVLAA